MSPEEQFLKIYEEYAQSVFRYCFYRVFDRERAQELMQEAFMKTWKTITKGKEIDNLRAYIFKVAGNLIIDNSRKKKEVSLENLQEQGYEPSYEGTKEINQSIDTKLALSLISKLEDKYREAIVLRYVEDLPVKEIAQIIGESESTTSVRIHRGLKQLRTIITHQNANNG